MAVYLLHFDRPFRHAKHYLGFAEDDRLHERIDTHYNARIGDNHHHRLIQHVRAAGISFTLARIWWGADRSKERRMKNRGHTARCPVCRPHLPTEQGRKPAGHTQ